MSEEDAKKPAKIMEHLQKFARGLVNETLERHVFNSRIQEDSAPIEIEMLAATWGMEKMTAYLRGLSRFTLQTDHKPLVPILNQKSLIDLSPRIQRLRMRMLKYNFVEEHVAGKDLTEADALSREPVSKPTKEEEFAEQEVNAHMQAVFRSLPASDKRIQEIRAATQADSTLHLLIPLINGGLSESTKDFPIELEPYWENRYSLSVVAGVVLLKDRAVIPKVLQKDILNSKHEGHSGIEKCKRRARQTVYWPFKNNQITQMVRQCETCRELLPSKPHAPWMSHESIPTKPWEKLGSDLFQYAGKSYLIIADYYSLWPEMYLLKKPNSSCVIEATKQTFARYGIPKTLGQRQRSLRNSRMTGNFNMILVY